MLLEDARRTMAGLKSEARRFNLGGTRGPSPTRGGGRSGARAAARSPALDAGSAAPNTADKAAGSSLAAQGPKAKTGEADSAQPGAGDTIPEPADKPAVEEPQADLSQTITVEQMNFDELEVEALKAEIATLRDEGDGLQTTNSELKEIVKDQAALAEQQYKEILRIKQELSAATQASRAPQACTEDAETQCSPVDAGEENSDAKSALETLEKEAESLREKLKAAEVAALDAGGPEKAELDAVRAELDAAQSELREERKEARRMQQRQKQLEDDLDSVRLRLAEAQTELQEQRDEMEELVQENAGLQAMAASESLEAETASALRLDLEASERARVELQGRLEAAYAELEAVTGPGVGDEEEAAEARRAAAEAVAACVHELALLVGAIRLQVEEGGEAMMMIMDDAGVLSDEEQCLLRDLSQGGEAAAAKQALVSAAAVISATTAMSCKLQGLRGIISDHSAQMAADGCIVQ